MNKFRKLFLNAVFVFVISVALGLSSQVDALERCVSPLELNHSVDSAIVSVNIASTLISDGIQQEILKPVPPVLKPSLNSEFKGIQTPVNASFKFVVPSNKENQKSEYTGPISKKTEERTSDLNSSPSPTLSPIKYTKSKKKRNKKKSKQLDFNSDVGLDFESYMKYFQQKMQTKWDPPKEAVSKHVVLLIKIAKDGTLLSCSIFESSGSKKVDNAAINAVKSAAPFKPLPYEYNGQYVNIQFSFDYNIIDEKHKEFSI